MTRALDHLGPHLLGRVPSKPDPRNYRLETFLSTNPLDVALSALLANKSVARATKDWATFITSYLKTLPGPLPPPPSPPPSADKVWDDPESVLDQGQTPHCIGYGGAQWGNTLPIDDHYTNADGDAIYYECKVIDGEPKAEDGSSVHSLATALKARNRIDVYAWASTISAIKSFVASSGPMIVGTDWTNDMFEVDASFYVHPTGGIAGGHCYLLIGYLPSVDAFEFLNSWGAGWGHNGRFFMKTMDFGKLLAAQGEALAAIELA